MILIEINEKLFNFANAHVVQFVKDKLMVYFDKDNILQLENHEDFDISNFEDFFVKLNVSDTETIYINKFTFMYLKNKKEILNFKFVENFEFEIDTSYEYVIERFQI